MAELIRMENVTKRYAQNQEGANATLHDVNLLIETGEFISIMGPSGSGKSTLLNIVGTLDRASSGTYWLEGNNVSECNDVELSSLRNQLIGFVFQGFNLIPTRTLAHNVALPLLYSGMEKEQALARAHDCLERVGLVDLDNRLPSQVSGGQQQRAAIARAIAGKPQLLLADEPTGSLDSKSGKEIMALFEELRSETITIILITHDADVAQAAERLIQIKDGYIRYDGAMY